MLESIAGFKTELDVQLEQIECKSTDITIATHPLEKKYYIKITIRYMWANQVSFTRWVEEKTDNTSLIEKVVSFMGDKITLIQVNNVELGRIGGKLC